ncbi:MAG TPA: phenylalanine--tRNA ligase subunit beta [Deltaproteobacteria bacterium]|nr:phenylalanine--tRNA ligase subunit beta [Deltaproteobacteria bacterium]HNS89132.1 phenylalanine--tRNA ligase subunit beta [Deltaproteobacteria bacterium]HUM19717.1 phenylalanine--tRNA ligase subunit beta [Deltaproteobacteria bacterium]
MKISYSWIKEFVDLDVDAAAAASALTMSGTEVEEVVHQTVPREVVCARVVEAKKHPNADKLFLCTVDTGTETLQVVCGAPNTRSGMMSAFAPVGCDLGPGMLVKKAKIRGEESFGVLLSERELGLTDDHTGIMEFDVETRPGEALVDALSLEDWVLDVNVTPNRGDCLSVMGVARELAALFGTQLKMPAFSIAEDAAAIESVLTVEIVDTKGCPRYAARYLNDVKIGKSPFAMRRRLFQSGVRAISNVVDITNYVMLEYGQPLHAFDSTLIDGGGIVVRKAVEGETFVTLDSVERRLRADDLLICDKAKAVALAGVMGGENSEVLPTTTSVVLESAFFDPAGIQKTSRGLGLSTEASYRFERGIDPAVQVDAANRAAWFMVRYAGARVYRGVIDVNHMTLEKRHVKLRMSYLRKVLGIDGIDAGDVRRIFTGLGCEIQDAGDGWTIGVPAFRHDLGREIDLVEEFIRVYGMDKVSPDLPTFKPMDGIPEEKGLTELRVALAAMGLTEVITYSFIAPRWMAFFPGEALELLNPISEEMKIMRTSIVPGLVAVVERNRKLQARDISLFEIGKTFHTGPGGKLPDEVRRLGIALSGMRFDPHWSEKGRPVDFYDIKGIAESLLGPMELKPSNHGHLKPGCQADIVLDGSIIGTVGSVHPDILGLMDTDDEILVLEVLLEPVLVRRWEGLREIPKFPSTWRDLSLVVDENVCYADIVAGIQSKGIREIRQVAAVDVYLGDKLPTGKKGVTIRITYQSDERTLEDAMISRWQDRIVASLRDDLGITLRQ